MEKAPQVTVFFRNNPNLCAHGASFHWWEAESTSLHDHDYYEFFIITSGSTYHILNGSRQILSQRTMCLIQPQDCHQFAPIPEQRCIHINLAVTGEKLSRLCAGLGIEPEVLLACSAKQLTLEDWDFSFFEQNAGELNYLLETGGREDLIAIIISDMLIHAITTMIRRQNVTLPACPDWLNRLLHKLRSPEYLDCRVADIYRLSGYSPPVVIRAFRQYTGETVVAALTKIKMDSAKRLLVSTDLTVLEIAGRLGYGSQSHFNKLFRNAAGMTPRAYRAQYQRPL